MTVADEPEEKAEAFPSGPDESTSEASSNSGPESSWKSTARATGLLRIARRLWSIASRRPSAR